MLIFVILGLSLPFSVHCRKAHAASGASGARLQGSPLAGGGIVKQLKCLRRALKPRRTMPTFALRRLTLATAGRKTSPLVRRSPRIHEGFTHRVPGCRSISGRWEGAGGLRDQSAVPQNAPEKIVFRFHSRDLHLVLGPRKDGKPVRFVVKLDGTPPGEDRGGDTDASGSGTLRTECARPKTRGQVAKIWNGAFKQRQ
jgi:thioredoxin family protein